MIFLYWKVTKCHLIDAEGVKVCQCDSFQCLQEQSSSKPDDLYPYTLQWRHNERDGVSNYQPQDCLLNHLFKTQIKENIKAVSLAFVRGIHRWPVNSQHKGPVTWKMFPFDDVIMRQYHINCSTTSQQCTVQHPTGVKWDVIYELHWYCQYGTQLWQTRAVSK